MNVIQHGILTLMKCAVTETSLPLPDGFSLEEAEPVASRQHIGPLIYYGAVQCAVPFPDPGMKKLFQKYTQYLLVSERQQRACEKLFTAFEEEGIDYIPLKGCILKPLYPQPQLRYMSDADILIRPQQYARISRRMAQLGFTPGEETDHEFPWNSPQLSVELHKRLVPSYDKDYYAYLGDGWDRAKPVTGHRFGYTPEDDFLFQFIHFAKHYRKGGIGCRYVLDLWLLQTKQILDEDYILRELEKLRLSEFYRNVCRLIRCWFEDAPMDEKTAFMTDYIFSGGSWGTWEKQALTLTSHSAAVQEPGLLRSVRFLLRKLFPPPKELSWHYPVLKKCPWLTPLFWPLRLVHILLFRRDKIRSTGRILKEASDEKMDAYHKSLQYVGLDYHFE